MLKTMRLLPSDFECDKYGLHVRYVVEEDASFILSLRTNPMLSRFIHKTSNDIDAQKNWIREYKVREQLGQDYYFIYSTVDELIGVNRIYNLKEKSCTGGSWICVPNANPNKSIATLLFSRDIMFELLECEDEIFDVRKGNKMVQRLHVMMGARKFEETELDYIYRLRRGDYFDNRGRILKLLKLV